MEECLLHKDMLIDFFMNMKDKVIIEELIVYEPIWSLKKKKVNI
jgi:hypothetical protein